MKIGIYMPGLGQSFANETVEKYTERLMHEMSFNTNGIQYELKTEKITFSADHESTVVSIYQKSPNEKLVYKIYDFKYHGILTEKFNRLSLILKNARLLLLVCKKSPLLIKRLFSPESYSRPFQTFYLFMIFFTIALSILLMFPATIELISTSKTTEAVITLKNKIYAHDIPYLSQSSIEDLSKSISPVIVALLTLLLLIVPNANVLIADLATEFVCANDYLEHGSQRQLLLGNLDLLVDYITETEKDCRIHFHTYSFGSILAIDYLYPLGNSNNKNTEVFCEAIITIGTPFEFIKSYYPAFYENRQTKLAEALVWLNIYSTADALSTNFRNDDHAGDSEFGITKSSSKPTNINYEFAPAKKDSIAAFLMLYSLKAHGKFWVSDPAGQSCLRLVHDEMLKSKIL